MSTIQNLLDRIDLLYDNAFTDAQKVEFMNMCQRELSPYFGIVVEDESLSTVEDQDYYTFPAGLTDVSQIIALGIGTSATPTTRYDYVKYEQGSRDDYPDVNNSYFQSVDGSGTKKLIINPTPSVTGYPIKIRYRKALTELSTTVFTASPDFDSNYHDLLVYYAIVKICKTGASPDAPQANMYQQEFDSLYKKMWLDKLIRDNKSKNKKRDNVQWHTGRKYVGD